MNMKMFMHVPGAMIHAIELQNDRGVCMSKSSSPGITTVNGDYAAVVVADGAAKAESMRSLHMTESTFINTSTHTRHDSSVF
jgi:hypothetical protein